MCTWIIKFLWMPRNMTRRISLLYLLLTYYCLLFIFLFPVDKKDQMDRYHPVIMRNLPYVLVLSFRETYHFLHICI